MRFGLRDFFWLMLVLALALGWWLEDPARRLHKRWFPRPHFTKVYYVQDLLPAGNAPLEDYDRLVADLRLHVTPYDWNFAGNSPAIEVFRTNHSLVVSHDPAGHDEIAEYLQSRRDYLNRNPQPARGGK